MRSSWVLTLALAVAMVPVEVSTAASGTVPAAVDLGTLGGIASHAYGVSGDTVVGDTNPEDDGGTEAFAYDLRTGTATHFGSPDGEGSTARGASGDTVVGHDGGGGTGGYAFAYDLGTGTMTDLGTLGGSYSWASSVSGDIVVGESQISGDTSVHAFAYDLAAGTMTDLGTLGGSYSWANSVSGDIVVGQSQISWNTKHAFAYDLGTGIMTDLGTLGGKQSSALGVSGDTVVGISQFRHGIATRHAFAYDLGTGTMTDLGTLGGSNSSARAVSGDTVVGQSEISGNTTIHAFAYDLGTGTMIDLGTVGGTDSRAEGVAGDTVVGYSYFGNGVWHAIVWRLARVGFSQATLWRPENTGTVQLAVTRTGNDSITATVRYAATAGTATPGRDYILPAGTLTFAPSQTTATIPVRIIDDHAAEGAETVVVSLAPFSRGTLLSTPTSTRVILRPSDQQPDALISAAAGSGYVGNNIHNTTGTDQTRTVSARRTRTRIFDVRIGNDGNVRNTFTVRGSANPTGATVRYYTGTTEITSQMRSTGGWPVTLARGASRTIRMRIKILDTAALGSSETASVTATWTGDGTRSDLVKGIVRVSR